MFLLYFVLAIISIIAYLRIKKYRHQKFDNPFSFDWEISADSLEEEQTDSLERRDAVLEKEFAWDELPSKEWDVIVVGAGISGLATAGVLARAGKRVLVLEQHHRAGGCSNEFYSGGVLFNVGIYYIWPIPMVKNLLSQLTDGKLRWRALPSPFDEVIYRDEKNQVQHTHIRTHAEGYSKFLTDSFPECKDEIEKFEALVKLGCEEAKRHSLQLIWLKFVPLWTVKFIGWLINRGWYTDIYQASKVNLKMMVSAATDNPYLRRVFAYPMGLFSTGTSEIVWSTYCQTVGTFYNDGAHLPAGGTAKLLYDVITAIEKRGGLVRMAVDVQQITVDSSGRVSGVSISARNSKTRQQINANCVVSAVGVPTTVEILPPHVPTRYRKYGAVTDGSTRRHGVVMLCVVLRGSHAEFELPHEGIHWFNPPSLDHAGEWLAKDVDQVYEDIKNSVEQNMPICIPSANPEFQERFPGKSAIQGFFGANIEWFEDERFPKLADAFGKAMWRQLKDFYPKLTDDKILSFEVSTPKDLERMLGRRGGATYGNDTSSFKFTDFQQMAELRPKSDIPGLYLVGQDILGRGLNAASFSGLIVAGIVLGEDFKADLIYAQNQRERDLKRKYMKTPT